MSTPVFGPVILECKLESLCTNRKNKKWRDLSSTFLCIKRLTSLQQDFRVVQHAYLANLRILNKLFHVLFPYFVWKSAEIWDFSCFVLVWKKSLKTRNPEAELQGLLYFGRTYDELSDPIIFSSWKSMDHLQYTELWTNKIWIG